MNDKIWLKMQIIMQIVKRSSEKIIFVKYVKLNNIFAYSFYLCHIHYNYKIVDIFILNIMISSFIFSGFWRTCHHLCHLLKKQRPKQCTVYKIWHFIIDFNPKNQEV
ncbi:hypothetical protein T12_7594 [Trichinella patagoniensis]|uniref:Uncharacterized protein n=1 Tax=Trichinella patagoniensis TaxID=990121 RepID=A0A0V1AGM1_9BILA|nr:hypothetical protein T12_7594 [Trichinella patagoniensis]